MASFLSNYRVVHLDINFTDNIIQASHEVLCNLLPDGAGGGHGCHGKREAQDLSYRHCGQPQKIGKTRNKLDNLSLGKTDITGISVIYPTFNSYYHIYKFTMNCEKRGKGGS